MRVNQLVLHNFRNYVNIDINFTANINVFIGPNAQGKTNLIEALYLAAMGRSHRTNTDQELIRWDQSAASIEVVFFRQDVENSLKIKFITSQNKEILYNSHPLPVREIIGSLNAILFSPEDLLLIKGAPVLRRRFLDNEISQANPVYYRQLLNYNRILGQRNNLLKKIREGRAGTDLLFPWDEQLAKVAATITEKRLESVKKLTMLANLHHRKLTSNSENLTVNYYLSGAKKDKIDNLHRWYHGQFDQQRKQDILNGSTGIGPHRDDLIILVNGKNLRNFGSQGQQRTGVLAMKLAELEFIKSETGEYPILLLDDVMSELDAARRSELLLFIRERIQTFITAADEQYFSQVKFGKFYHIQSGMVTE
ncbi:DNA replication and repair protein RecF [Sporomusa silvacetica DSM 10669]|uniref:DNA replication and repair protein RecF n=1 Tax=Sporomusa silvacetica DSM 10669 TaxID=1123289 RepID=A0ABZ3IE22_9FIRM|nr:DNA replication/repair protein RecF [Sporomusa silvacetica]OZC23560.1 DNA replication and repair protein RecF [Sporomusa silvacetica DSM 10669]